MNTTGTLLFFVCGFAAIVSALGTVSARSPLRAAMSLLIHITSLAGIYLTLRAHFLAALQLLVYAGAVVVLFVFVIMLLGPVATQKQVQKHVVSRSIAGAVIAMVVAAVAFNIGSFVADPPNTGWCVSSDKHCLVFGGARGFASELFGKPAVQTYSWQIRTPKSGEWTVRFEHGLEDGRGRAMVLGQPVPTSFRQVEGGTDYVFQFRNHTGVVRVRRQGRQLSYQLHIPGMEVVRGATVRPALVPFEMASILLLVAIVGAIAIARGRDEVSKPTKSKIVPAMGGEGSQDNDVTSATQPA